MIQLTVKTLDSQNHAFIVDDNLTVAQFKEKIADTVNVPPDTQRIIYCGRLLQDESKLCELDLDGKVVHLVQRPPPNANDRSNQRSETESPTPQPQHRRIRGLEYLGSMRFPASAFDSNAVPPLPTHSLAASRLNVARRMLRRAEAVLNALENPTTRSSDQPTSEEPQEEITPIFEARVIVPSEAVVLSSVSDLPGENGNSTLQATSAAENQDAVEGSISTPTTAESGDLDAAPPMMGIDTPHSVSSTPEVVSPLATSAENLNTTGDEQVNDATVENNLSAGNEASANNTTANNANSDNMSRTVEYADLLESLNRFQIRFAPFLEQYHNFMREDPSVSLENARSTQAMINRVSEILHFLGHAYHSLSDIIVRARTPPPRPLMCRPILVQHSAIVQAGIPIQVEAQINFSTDRNATTAVATATSQTSTTTAAATQTTTSTTSNNGTGTVPSNISASVQPTLVGFPLIPGAGGLRFEAFHLPAGVNVNLERGTVNQNNNRDAPLMTIRSDFLAQTAAAIGAVANNSGATNPMSESGPTVDNSTMTEANSATPSANNATSETPSCSEAVTNTSTMSAPQSSTANTGGSGGPQVTVNNPNVEFFMEVTPESITIDSLETAFIGGNQPNDILQGSLNPPPPEIIQSIMQMAGQLINRRTQGGLATTTAAASIPTSSPPTSTPETQTTLTTTAGAARTTPFQNSQARGNTQTQPTTATHTRSTARPHVHLSQHAMQGFDPFLPCNSHHVTPRRRGTQQSASAQQQSSNPVAQTNTNPPNSNTQANTDARIMDPNSPLYYMLRNVINSVRTTYGMQGNNTQGSLSAASSSTASVPNSTVSHAWMANLQNVDLSDSSFRAPTIAQLLQQIPDDSYVEGESIFTDLIMLLSRNLTIGDVMQLNSGRLDPLMRIRIQLRNFFLYRILDGSQTTASIDRGVEKLLEEIQPLFDHFQMVNIRDDIDIVRSINTLLRARLPNILSLVTSRNNSIKMFVDQVCTTAKHLCALAVHACSTGQTGVEQVFDSIVTNYMHDIPSDLQQWTLITSRAQFNAFVSNLDVPQSLLQPYIVRNVDVLNTSVVLSESSTSSSIMEIESMQVEEDPEDKASSSTTETQINLNNDSEPLPTVVLGSETWHSQVPADWVPIIARDSQKQRRQSTQPPFSDAYLSGMPSKRRKIVSNSKPQGSLPQVISESMRRATTVTGLTAVAPVDVVAQAAGADLGIQSAYRDLFRSSVQLELRNNEDFTPERFPNASSYFNSSRPQ